MMATGHEEEEELGGIAETQSGAILALSSDGNDPGSRGAGGGVGVGGGLGGVNGKRVRSDAAEWSESAITGLLDAFGTRYIASHRGNLRLNDWEDVTRAVNARGITGTKSIEQCRNKIDNLKKRFKLEREKGGASLWPWFRTLDGIVGGAPKRGGGGFGTADGGPGVGQSPEMSLQHNNVKLTIPLEVLHLQQQQQQQQQQLLQQQQQQQQSLQIQQQQQHQQQILALTDPVPPTPQLPQLVAAIAASNPIQDESDPENVAETPYSSQRDSHTTDFPTSFKGGVGKDVMSEMTNPNPKVDAASGGTTTGGKPNRKKRKNICHAGKDVAASIASFADVFAKIEFAKMELFKDMEMRRLDMQYKLAKLAHNRRKGRSTNSASSGSDGELNQLAEPEFGRP